MSPRIAQLKEAVETMHKCTARHVESNVVIELFQGEIAWDGVVETFELTGHPKANRCYAWSYFQNGEPQYLTVLELPPLVTSAESAVKVAIVEQSKLINRKKGTP
jgi:hypothetical protein